MPILPYFATFVIVGILVSSLGPTMLPLTTQASLSVGSGGTLIALRALGFVIGSLLFGKALDRLPGHKVIAISALSTAVLLAFIPLTSQPIAMLALFMAFGICESGLDVGGNTLLFWSRPHNPGPAINALHFCFGIGAVIGPGLVALTYSLDRSPLELYWLMALLASALGITYLCLPHSPRPPAHHEEAGSVIPKQKRSLLIAFLVFFFLWVGAEVTIGAWLHLVALNLAQISPARAASMTTLFYVTFTLGRLLATFTTRFVGAGTVVKASVAASVVILAATAAWWTTEEGFWALAALLGLAMAAVFASTLAWLNASLPVSARVTAMVLVSAGAGSSLFPWLAGRIADRGWFAGILVLVGILVVFSAFFVIFLHALIQKQTQENVSSARV